MIVPERLNVALNIFNDKQEYSMDRAGRATSPRDSSFHGGCGLGKKKSGGHKSFYSVFLTAQFSTVIQLWDLFMYTC